MQKAKSRIKKLEQATRLQPPATAVIALSILVISLWALTFYFLLLTPEPTEPIVINHTIIKSIQHDKGVNFWTGKASYYSREGCIGCSESLTMANGQPLDDSKLTVAFNKLPLGKTVRVINNTTYDVVEAKITDTGGFERLGRIIDLSVATKEAINCSDICDVTILYK